MRRNRGRAGDTLVGKVFTAGDKFRAELRSLKLRQLLHLQLQLGDHARYADYLAAVMLEIAQRWKPRST